MEERTKCPVCGKEGIPDYHQGDVRCPSCGSNLEPFRLLDVIEQENNAKSSKWKPIALASMALALLFAILYFSKGGSDSTKAEAADEAVAKTEQVAKPANTAGQRTAAQPVASSTAEPEAGQQENAGKTVKEEGDEITAPADMVTVRDGKKYYTVKGGDTWWKITKKLYNGKVKIEDLARMNSRSVDKSLEIGEELIVK